MVQEVEFGRSKAPNLGPGAEQIDHNALILDGDAWRRLQNLLLCDHLLA